jgi:hypothetical protein
VTGPWQQSESLSHVMMIDSDGVTFLQITCQQQVPYYCALSIVPPQQWQHVRQ